MTPTGTTSVPSGNVQTVSCKAGYSGGSVNRSCSNGSWSGSAPTCTPNSCTAQSLSCGAGKNCAFPLTAHGNTGTTSCPAGYTGTPQRSCSLGTWGGLSGDCRCNDFIINNYTSSDQWQSKAAGISGGIVTVWHSGGQDGNGYGTYSRAFNASRT